MPAQNEQVPTIIGLLRNLICTEHNIAHSKIVKCRILDLIRPNDRYDQGAGLVAVISPRVACAVLDQAVAGLEVNFFLVVKFK